MTLWFNWQSNLISDAVRARGSARREERRAWLWLTSSLDNRDPLSSSVTMQQPTFTSLFQRMSLWKCEASQFQRKSVVILSFSSRIPLSACPALLPEGGSEFIFPCPLWPRLPVETNLLFCGFIQALRGEKMTVRVISLEIFSNPLLIYIHVAPLDDTQVT